jgi:hypothetical protein
MVNPHPFLNCDAGQNKAIQMSHTYISYFRKTKGHQLKNIFQKEGEHLFFYKNSPIDELFQAFMAENARRMACFSFLS